MWEVMVVVFVANDPLNVSSTYYTDLTEGLGIRQFYKIGISQTNPVIVSGGSQDNGTSVYRADGIWYDWLGADGMETFIDHSNPNIMYGTSQNGGLYKSTDQGASRFGLNQLLMINQGIGSLLLNRTRMMPTLYTLGMMKYINPLDGGSNWNSISQNFGSNADHLKIAPSDSNIMYAAFGENLYTTTNGGFIGDWTHS